MNRMGELEREIIVIRPLSSLSPARAKWSKQDFNNLATIFLELPTTFYSLHLFMNRMGELEREIIVIRPLSSLSPPRAKWSKQEFKALAIIFLESPTTFYSLHLLMNRMGELE